MNSVKNLSELRKGDTGLAGGKGASLGELINAGISVPPGFVVVSSAFDEFLSLAGLDVEIEAVLNTVDHREMHTVENASEKIHALILRTAMPAGLKKEILDAFKKLGATFVAVRSSATAEDGETAAWAGQLETYLNTTEKNLIENILKCWASLFSPRAIFYRFQKGMKKDKVSVAVVVQEMVESEKSGIAFSVHPVTQDRNQMIIEAGLGLGEAIVSGTITPDSYVVRKNDLTIIERQTYVQKKGLFRKKNGGNEWRNIGEKEGSSPALSDKETCELAALIVRIEKHYGFPVDVEWAQAKGSWFFTQSRPITTLSSDLPKKEADAALNYEFSWGERHSVMTAEMWASSYLKYRKLLANENRHVFMHVKGGFVHTYTAAEELSAALEAGTTMLRQTFLKEYLKDSKGIRVAFRKLYDRVQKIDLKRASNEKLAEILREYVDAFEYVYALFKITQPEYTTAAADALRAKVSALVSEKDVDNALNVLCSDVEHDPMKLDELAAIRLSLKPKITEKDMREFIEEFPWYFFNTYDRTLAADFLRSKFDDLRSIPAAERKKTLEDAKKAIAKHRKEHAAWIIKTKKDPDIAYLSTLLGTLGSDRLELKKWWTGSEYLFLDFFDEIARRIGLGTEEMLMTHRPTDMFDALDGKKLPSSLRASRKKSYAVFLNEDAVEFLEHAKADDAFATLVHPSQSKSVASGKNTITGTVANPGIARGTARIIRVEDLKTLLKDMKRFKKDEIIVTTMTQPTVVGLARIAAAIVTDEGGITSHAAILAREYGIPCIVGAKIATRIIKDGDEIEVNATAGTVRILQSPKKTD